MDYSLNLSGKTVIVTGAAGGIGTEVCKGFLENGSRLIAVDYNKNALDEAVNSLKELFPDAEVLAICADLTKKEDVDSLSEKIKAFSNTVDVLVNNAGTGNNVYSVNEQRDSWQRVIELNLNSTFFVSQAIANSFFIPQRKGKIVNMCSLSALLGIPNSVSYSASKGAVLQMTKSLASEWARFNITVNAVCPGFVDTQLIADAKSNERWLGYVTLRNPMKRLAQPEDIVGPTLFLSSELSKYVNGTYIVVDGGFSCS